jgi:hypothetical protein
LATENEIRQCRPIRFSPSVTSLAAADLGCWKVSHGYGCPIVSGIASFPQSSARLARYMPTGRRTTCRRRPQSFPTCPSGGAFRNTSAVDSEGPDLHLPHSTASRSSTYIELLSTLVAHVGSQTPWRIAVPLPAALQTSHQNGGRIFLIFVANPRNLRLCMKHLRSSTGSPTPGSIWSGESRRHDERSGVSGSVRSWTVPPQRFYGGHCDRDCRLRRGVLAVVAAGIRTARCHTAAAAAARVRPVDVGRCRGHRPRK